MSKHFSLICPVINNEESVKYYLDMRLTLYVAFRTKISQSACPKEFIS